MEQKLEIRKLLLRQRGALGKTKVKASSVKICEHILATDAYKNAQCILGYLSFGAELSVDAVLAQALKDEKRVCVPYIISNTEFVAARLVCMDDFVLDRYGIRSVCEPIEVIEPKDIDLVLVPGVAFAKNGGRMGMGAGYYDRFLLKTPQAKLLGIAYEELLQESLPLDKYDVLIPYLVTEDGVIETICRNKI